MLASPPIKVDGLVIEAVYPTIETATRNRLRKDTGPLEPILSPLLLLQLKPRLGVAPIDLRPVEHVHDIGCPVLVIGGEDDQNTTVEDTKLIFAAAQDPKELWLLRRAGHVDFCRFAPSEYEARVAGFFHRAFDPR